MSLNVAVLPPKSIFEELQQKMGSFAERYGSSQTRRYIFPHISLKVVSGANSSEFDGMVTMVNEIAAATQPFQLDMAGLRHYGTDPEHPAICINVDKSQELLELHLKLLERLGKFDHKDHSWKDGKNYNPHLTLLYPDANLEKAKKDLRDWNPEYNFVADKIHLIGAENEETYEILKEFEFRPVV